MSISLLHNSDINSDFFADSLYNFIHKYFPDYGISPFNQSISIISLELPSYFREFYNLFSSGASSKTCFDVYNKKYTVGGSGADRLTIEYDTKDRTLAKIIFHLEFTSIVSAITLTLSYNATNSEFVLNCIFGSANSYPSRRTLEYFFTRFKEIIRDFPNEFNFNPDDNEITLDLPDFIKIIPPSVPIPDNMQGIKFVYTDFNNRSIELDHFINTSCYSLGFHFFPLYNCCNLPLLFLDVNINCSIDGNNNYNLPVANLMSNTDLFNKYQFCKIESNMISTQVYNLFLDSYFEDYYGSPSSSSSSSSFTFEELLTSALYNLDNLNECCYQSKQGGNMVDYSQIFQDINNSLISIANNLKTTVHDDNTGEDVEVSVTDIIKDKEDTNLIEIQEVETKNKELVPFLNNDEWSF